MYIYQYYNKLDKYDVLCNDPYVFPDRLYPISSYYWVSANYEFKAPVYFIMNHYAKIRNLEGISNLHMSHKCTHKPNADNNDKL